MKNIKHFNIHITKIQEEEEIQQKKTNKHIFKEIMTKIFPKCVKGMN